MPPCGRLAMENGIQGYEMNAQWARQAIEELKRNRKQCAASDIPTSEGSNDHDYGTEYSE